jgi:calcineurin-like phosphoesterase family protein
MLESVGPTWGRLSRLPITRRRAQVLVAAIVAVAVGSGGAVVGFAGGAARGAGDPILVGAGDIAAAPAGRRGGDEATARLLDAVVAANRERVTVFTVGDNAYPAGSSAEFGAYYAPTWGRYKARTRPAPGNHDYATPLADEYFDYFRKAAGPEDRGYYAYDRGAWRIYSLDSEIDRGPASEQVRWLRNDLAEHDEVRCVLAYFHRPLFSSGLHGSEPTVRPFWQALYDHRADLVLSAHDHNYQRFAPQTPAGRADSRRGIRELVVGTGGNRLYRSHTTIANQEASYSDGYGVLKLTLHSDRYEWEFITAGRSSFRDHGKGRCN